MTPEPEPHVHEFVGEKYYTADTVNNKAYINQACGCGVINTVEVANAIVLTPTNAQSILDGVIDNKTLVFSDGVYQNLEVRPTKQDGYAREFLSSTTYGDTDLDLETLSTPGQYHYFRDIENIKIVSTKNAVFTGRFMFNSSVNHPNSGIKYDPIRDIDYSAPDAPSNTSHTNHLSTKNIEVSGLKFTGNGAISWDVWQQVTDVTNKDISVHDCSFIAETSYGYAAIYMNIFKTAGFENIVVENNLIKKHYQGIMIINAKNVEANNNTIIETAHNGIAVQSNDANTFSGTINIKNNIITDLGNQAIKLNKGSDAVVTVANNVMANSVWANRKYVIQLGGLTNGSYAFTNNIYNGDLLKDLTAATGDHAGFYIYSADYVLEEEWSEAIILGNLNKAKMTVVYENDGSSVTSIKDGDILYTQTNNAGVITEVYRTYEGNKFYEYKQTDGVWTKTEIEEEVYNSKLEEFSMNILVYSLFTHDPATKSFVAEQAGDFTDVNVYFNNGKLSRVTGTYATTLITYTFEYDNISVELPTIE